jgi:hypothetical protein
MKDMALLFARPDNQIDCNRRAELSLAKHLGGAETLICAKGYTAPHFQLETRAKQTFC